MISNSKKMTGIVEKSLSEFEHLDESELEELYTWVDGIPLSRPKRNINRDFSDGVLTAEVVRHFIPKLVDIHNYTSSSSTDQKKQNWSLLNSKVFRKLNFRLSEESIKAICTCKPIIIECFLMFLRSKIERALWEMKKTRGDRIEMSQAQQKASMRLQGKPSKGFMPSDQPEADQNLSIPAIASKSPVKVGHSKGQIVSPGRQQKSLPHAGPYRGTKMKLLDEQVSRALYEEKEQECLAKEETIQILQAKVRRLEHLLHLKDIRIEDLQSRLEVSRPTGNMNVRR